MLRIMESGYVNLDSELIYIVLPWSTIFDRCIAVFGIID